MALPQRELTVRVEIPDRDEATIRSRPGGNICRCTGHHDIVDAVRYASELRRGTPA